MSHALLALWSGAAFEAVHSYEDWEDRVNERLDDAIALGEMVPVGIQGDGAFAVRVAAAPGGLTDREQQFTVVTSDPYLLVTDGPTFLTGVESVGDRDSAPLALELGPGRYSVRVSLVAWDDEPETLVTVTIRPEGNGTRLTFRQEPFADAASRDSHESGWGECLDRLVAEIARHGERA